MPAPAPVPAPAAAPAPALRVVRTGVEPPEPQLVHRLRRATGYPAISVLMTTTPAAVMTDADRARLTSLVREAGRRLAGEEREHGALLLELDRLADEAARRPTGASVAIFVSATTALTTVLPVEVVDRVVVDPTFATRDLVRAMHRTPRHAVLVLSAREAVLHEAVGGVLAPAPGHRFPVRATPARAQRGTDPDRPRLREAEASAYLRTVARALAVHLAARPMPVVLVGPPRLVARLRSVAPDLRVVATVPANLARVPLEELAERLRSLVERYLRSREAEAMALLDRRTGEDRAVSGLAATWLAARRERPEMLAVEEGLYAPVRLSADGDYVTPADDLDHPDVVDDLVDELIETVLSRGGWVALVADGTLAAHDGVALTLRRAF